MAFLDAQNGCLLESKYLDSKKFPQFGVKTWPRIVKRETGSHPKTTKVKERMYTKFDIIYLLEALDANPNGDPDQEGAPRQDPDSGHGLMSPGCINRKLRNYVSRARGNAPPFNIQIRRDNRSIESTILDVARSDAELKKLIPTADAAENDEKKTKNNGKEKEKGKEKKSKLSNEQTNRLTSLLTQEYWDVRVFGGVHTVGKMPANKTTGAVATMFARSVYPVEIHESALTRCMTANEKESETKDQGMGRYHRIPYALYRGAMHVNAFHAHDNGCTEEDMALLLEALVRCWDLDRTNFRGTLNLKGLWVVRHASPLGSCRGDRIQSALKIHCDDPIAARSYEEYEVSFEDLPDNVRVFTLDEIDRNPMCVFDTHTREAAE